MRGAVKKALALLIFFSLLFPSSSRAEELFRLKWKRYVGKCNWAFTNQPLIFGGYVLHASNGNINNREFSCCKSYLNDNKDIYDKLSLFDARGNLLWSFAGETDMNGVVAAGDLIVATDEAGHVYALNFKGELIWRLKLKDNICIWAISLGDLNEDGGFDAVVGTWDGTLYVLSDGRPIWKFKTGDWVVSSPALGDLDGDGYLDVVVGSGDHYVYALSGSDGRLLWKFETGADVDSSPALGDLDGDGYLDVVVGSGDHYVYALSGRDGSLLWKFETGGSVVSSPALGDLDGDGALEVVVGSRDNHVYALSGRDGRLIWKFKTEGSVDSSPALGDLDGDGYIDLAVASEDGYLYVFEATRKGGRVVWSRFHGDAAGTGLYKNALSFAEANLSGNAFAWDPHPKKPYGLLIKLSRSCEFCALEKIAYKPSSNPRINLVKHRKLVEKAILTAKNRIKRKTALTVKAMVERLSREAELSDRKTVEAIYRKLLSEAFKKIDGLKSYAFSEPKKGELYLLVNADRVLPAGRLEARAAELIARALEGQEIKATARVEIPKLEAPEPSDGVSQGAAPESFPAEAGRGKCVRPYPNFYLFGAVVYDYRELSDLGYVRNDKGLLLRLATCYMGIPEDHIKILENPSYAYLRKELRRFAEGIRRKDAVLYFYYSGHGVLDSEGRFYLLPADASIEDENVLRESGVDIKALKELLGKARGKKVALIDACRLTPPWKPAVLVYKPRLTDMAIIFSTQKGRLSNRDREGRFSAFTRALYEMANAGLANLDFDDDGYVEIKELIKPLTRWVRRVSADRRQTPEVWGPKDFEMFPVE